MEWLFLIIAILLETVAVILLKTTPGFDRFIYGLLIVVIFVSSLYFEFLALKKLDISLSYTIWVISGIVLVNIFGVIYLDEKINILKIISLIIIISGTILFFYSNNIPKETNIKKQEKRK